MEGWIKLYRKFSEWEWFNISEMVHLFIYLLLNANYENDNWRGVEIKRGQILTGLDSLNKKTGISIQTLRTCLKRLEETKEINMQVTNKYRIITICNYELYQCESGNINKHPNKQLTSNQQATNSKQEEEEIIRRKEINKIEFVDFWNLYNHKLGNKEKCRIKWDKLSYETQSKIISILPAYLKTINDKKFQPFPETWLNQKRWENEDLLSIKRNGNEILDKYGKPKPSDQYILVNGKWTVI